jgi:hypothetical protein
MSKSTRNSGKGWTPADKKALKDLAKGNTPTRVIGLKLGRTPEAVQAQASRQRVSLKPTNRRPTRVAARSSRHSGFRPADC